MIDCSLWVPANPYYSAYPGLLWVGRVKCNPDYFSLGVKNEREELYDREEELSALENSAHPITTLTGIRRLGKSSLLATGLKRRNALVVDFRGTGPNPSPLFLLNRFEEALNSSGLRNLWEHLSKRVSSITLGPLGVSFAKTKPLTVSFATLFDAINEYAERAGTDFVVAFDEAQEARGYKPLIGAIARSYDYNRRIRFVLAGSQTGLLNDFLSIQDPASPLYGRYVYELALKRFSKQDSLEFLRRGFEACGAEPLNIEEAVQRLDGIVGWLVYYGYMCLNEDADLARVVDSAVNLELKELSKLRGKYYRLILKAVTLGANTWSEIYRYVKANTEVLSDASFNEALGRLVKYSVLEKKDEEYMIPDPITNEAARRL